MSEPVPTHVAPTAPPDAGRHGAVHKPMELSADVNAAAEAAMRAATAAMPRPAQVKPVGGAAIRGPRLVQAGREHRTGKVVAVGPSDVFLEFGPKELGVAPRLQWPDEELPKVADSIEVVIDKYDRNESIFICSRPGAVTKAAWESLEPGQTVDAKVTGVNKGGLELEVAGHRAFMPASQVSLDRIADLSVFVGEKMACQVTRVDRAGGGNIILSRRDVLAQEREQKAAKLKELLKEGAVLEGTVKKIMPFGAFVDLGGIEGLVHISDMTYERAGYGEQRVNKYVKEGEHVKVQVLKLDWDNNRLSLGMKQVQADPFAAAANDIKDGAEVTGKVTRIAEFGAFIELAPGVEGLVHISEISYKRIGRVEDALKPDEIVKAKVLKVDPQSRRISLSIKALAPPPEPRMGGGGARREEKAPPTKSFDEAAKNSPALRRLKEKFGKTQFKGGIG